jgi:hypothetical protein
MSVLGSTKAQTLAAAEHLNAANVQLFGFPMPAKQLALLLAHTHLESGWGTYGYIAWPENLERRAISKTEWDALGLPEKQTVINNWGAMHALSASDNTYQSGTFLGRDSDGAGMYYPAFFYAFDTQEAGALAYLKRLFERWSAAYWDSVLGDPYSFARILKATGYYQAPEQVYADALAKRLPLIQAELAPPPKPASGGLGVLLLVGAAAIAAFGIARSQWRG